MRLLLGFLLLLTLFAGALAWQRHFGETALAARSDAVATAALDTPPAAGEPPPAARPYPSDWGRVIVGRPSGAEPVVVANETRAAPTPSAPARTNGPAPVVTNGVEPATAAREFELTVQSGQTLSSICEAHYHSSRPALVNALARYNKIADPSRMRAGQKLKLPPEADLLAR